MLWMVVKNTSLGWKQSLRVEPSDLTRVVDFGEDITEEKCASGYMILRICDVNVSDHW